MNIYNENYNNYNEAQIYMLMQIKDQPSPTDVDSIKRNLILLSLEIENIEDICARLDIITPEFVNRAYTILIPFEQDENNPMLLEQLGILIERLDIWEPIIKFRLFFTVERVSDQLKDLVQQIVDHIITYSLESNQIRMIKNKLENYKPIINLNNNFNMDMWLDMNEEECQVFAQNLEECISELTRIVEYIEISRSSQR